MKLYGIHSLKNSMRDIYGFFRDILALLATLVKITFTASPSAGVFTSYLQCSHPIIKILVFIELIKEIKVHYQILSGILLSLFICGTVMAERKLTPSEIMVLLDNKSFDAYFFKRRQNFKVYSNLKGLWEVRVDDLVKKRQWRINENGEFCVKKTMFFRCGAIFDLGNGEYKRTVNGKEIQRLRNFRKGR